MTYTAHDTFPRVNDTDLLVLAGGGKKAAVEVERYTVDGVHVALNTLQGLTGGHMPNEALHAQRTVQ